MLFEIESQANQEVVEYDLNDMDECHMSDMDEQETVVHETSPNMDNESNANYERAVYGGSKLRNLQIFRGNTSGENINFGGNMLNSSSNKDSLIHQPKEFPYINPSGLITENNSKNFTDGKGSNDFSLNSPRLMFTDRDRDNINRIPQILY